MVGVTDPSQEAEAALLEKPIFSETTTDFSSTDASTDFASVNTPTTNSSSAPTQLQPTTTMGDAPLHPNTRSRPSAGAGDMQPVKEDADKQDKLSTIQDALEPADAPAPRPSGSAKSLQFLDDKAAKDTEKQQQQDAKAKLDAAADEEAMTAIQKISVAPVSGVGAHAVDGPDVDYLIDDIERGLLNKIGEKGGVSPSPQISSPSPGKGNEEESPSPASLERLPNVSQRQSTQPGAIPVAGIGGTPEELPVEEAPSLEPSPLELIDSNIVAEAVTRDDLEEEIQRRIIAEATVGEVVHPEDMVGDKKSPQEKRKEKFTIGFIVLIATAVLITLLAVFLTQKEDDNPVNQAELQSFLETASLEAFDMEDPNRLKLSKSDSPQAQAMEWLSENLEFFPVNNATQEQHILETYALATLFYSTGGNETWDTTNPEFGLESWMVGTDACVWLPDPESDCNMDGLVVEVTLEGVGLNNTLPEELLFLTKLQELNVWANQLTGSLPMAILPPNIQALYLDGNLFEGEIPSETTQLTNLTHLGLSHNPKLTASLPEDVVASWTNLQVLQLDDTPIQGPIPSTIGKMTSLLYFSAAQVGFSGDIPTEIGLCKELQTFHIPQYSDLTTNITGKLPEELWTISNLQSIDTTYIGLSFTIPGEYMEPLGSSLRALKFGTSRVQGTLPTEIGYLSKLEVMEMDNSALLGGTIPSQIGMMESLTFIDLSRNPNMVGSLPTQIGHLTNLEKLWLFSSTSFGGSLLPTEIGLCTKLQSLNMKGAEISSGRIPSEIGLLPDLEELELLRTNMTGPIPSQIGLLQNFEVLTIGGLGITGTLPTELAQATSITKILVAGTNVGGTIPWEYGALADMDKFAIAKNQFTGTLPKTLAGWNKLDSFSINNNEFTGTFPRDYQDWTEVTRVMIYSTNLTGEIGSYTCGGWGEDHEVKADCAEVECDRCCTHCCEDDVCEAREGYEDDRPAGKGKKGPQFFPPIRNRNRIRGRARA